MPTLTILHSGIRTVVPFTGAPVLLAVLRQAGLAPETPCGGRGVCGGCKVEAQGALAPLTQRERQAGGRLSCQSVLLGDTTVTLPQAPVLQNIAAAGDRPPFAFAPAAGRYAMAVDVGTTTLAATLLDLRTGQRLASAAQENPQRALGADVLTRIDAALHGQAELMRQQVCNGITALHRELCQSAGLAPEPVDAMALTGNTAMLHLLTGTDPSPLAQAPFAVERLFGEWLDAPDFLPARRVYLPPCFSAFVGADTASALLASGLCDKEETALLADIGTNGELALLHKGKLWACSAAAGPAFEGGGLSYGCASIPGAIDHVWASGGQLVCSTIGEQPAVGICGSGVPDALATLLAQGRLAPSGYLAEESVTLGNGIALTQQDIRQVQLAKGAIAAGLQRLLQMTQIEPEQVQVLYLAGGFGTRLDARSAAAIGLIPKALADKCKPIGNAALLGAEMLLLNTDFSEVLHRFTREANVVNLGGDPAFAELFMRCMALEAM